MNLEPNKASMFAAALVRCARILRHLSNNRDRVLHVSNALHNVAARAASAQIIESGDRWIVKKHAQIIPFPNWNGRNYSTIRLQPQAKVADDKREQRAAAGDSASVMSRLTDSKLPLIPDVYGQMNERCDVLVDAMQVLAEYMEGGGEEAVRTLRVIWRRGDALREHYSKLLERTPTTATKSSGAFRAIITLDMAIDCAKITTGYITNLGRPVDRFMLEMAAENERCARALQRGFHKLAMNPVQVAEDSQGVYRAKRNIERINRYALGELVANAESVKTPKLGQESSKAMSSLFGMYERREIYHHFLKSAKRLVWAANNLRGLASHLGIM